MDIRALRYALTLAEELHFGKAAQAHFIAPQQFGRRIQELEHELGVTLFERSTRRVTVTAAGERFLPRARRVLADVDDLAYAATDRDEPVLRVGVLGYGLADYWPTVRSIFESQNPGTAIAYTDLTWADQYDAVRTGDVDIAIVHHMDAVDDLAIDKVMTSDRYAVVPAGHDLADAAFITADQFADYPSVVPIGQPGLVAWGLSRNRLHEAHVRSPASIPNAVAASGFVGIHAEPARRFLAHPGVRYVPYEGTPATVAIAARRRDERPRVASFRGAVRIAVDVEGISPVD